MSTQDKTYLENISRVFSILPDSKREYLMGVADGMAVMAQRETYQAAGQRERESSENLRRTGC